MTLATTITLCPLDANQGLTRLEQVLGLARPRMTAVDRLFRYAAACETSGVVGWQASLAVDRFGTAMHLLRRREEALHAGWDGVAHTTPALADLAAAEMALAAGPGRDLGTEGDRLRRIAAGLALGLRVSVVVEMSDPKEWSPLWQQVAATIRTVVRPPVTDPAAGGSLGAWQRSLSDRSGALKPDATLALTCVGGRQAGAQALAALLAESSHERRAATVVVCADAELLTSLDDRLARAGLPRLGAPTVGSTTALDGLLPLVVALCWDPVDPGLLLEYCLLPDGPLGRRAGSRLAEALARFPGLGSQSWEATITQLTSAEADPDGTMAKRLSHWFVSRRIGAGCLAPADLLAGRCRAVAAWAGARAATADGDSPFLTLASGAARLADLFATTGGQIAAPAAARLLADALPGTAAGRHTAEAGAPLLVDQPWRIPANTQHVIWIAPTTDESRSPSWTAQELQALNAAGLAVDDGEDAAAARRAGDRLGLCHISGDLLVVELPPAHDRRRHPAAVVLHVGMGMAGVKPALLPRLDDPALADLELAGWRRRCVAVAAVAAQPERHSWTGPPGGLRDRETHSYSELERRLACPLAWTLNYAAKLRGGGAASLPEDHVLQGTFAHAVLERVFSAGIPKPEAAATMAGACFDDRIGRDAVPLAMPGRQAERRGLRDRVVETARLLAETVTRAGCTQVAMEAPISGEVGGRKLSGSIDCLATGVDLAVIVDLKLGSFDRHYGNLASGRAVQLAVYASTRSERTVAVAYGIINRRRMLTPEGAAIPHADDYGCEVVPGAPGWRETWGRFSAALDADQAWRAGGPIPARPLGDPASWPAGADIVLDPSADVQTSCSYCDYGVLCGREKRI